MEQFTDRVAAAILNFEFSYIARIVFLFGSLPGQSAPGSMPSHVCGCGGSVKVFAANRWRSEAISILRFVTMYGRFRLSEFFIRN